MMCEVEKLGQLLCRTVCVARIGQPCVGVTQLVEEWMNHCIDGRQSLCRCVLEELGDQIDGIWLCLAEDLGGKLVSNVIIVSNNEVRTLLNG